MGHGRIMENHGGEKSIPSLEKPGCSNEHIAAIFWCRMKPISAGFQSQASSRGEPPWPHWQRFLWFHRHKLHSSQLFGRERDWKPRERRWICTQTDPFLRSAVESSGYGTMGCSGDLIWGSLKKGIPKSIGAQYSNGLIFRTSWGKHHFWKPPCSTEESFWRKVCLRSSLCLWLHEDGPNSRVARLQRWSLGWRNATCATPGEPPRKFLSKKRRFLELPWDGLVKPCSQDVHPSPQPVRIGSKTLPRLGWKILVGLQKNKVRGRT